MAYRQIRKGVNGMNDGTSDLLSEIRPWKCGRKVEGVGCGGNGRDTTSEGRSSPDELMVYVKANMEDSRWVLIWLLRGNQKYKQPGQGTTWVS